MRKSCSQTENHRLCHFGIDEEAERKICIFAPDYLEVDDLKEESLVLIRCTKSPKDSLTHRDYLGSLMGLGIVRETVGDIFVHENGADIVVLPEIKDFILTHFSRAGRKEISVEVITHSEINTGLSQGVIKTGSISSLRADCVIAEIWGMSRTLSKEAIDQGRFILNGYECKKPDKEIAEGDKLNLRGKGKAAQTVESIGVGNIYFVKFLGGAIPCGRHRAAPRYSVFCFIIVQKKAGSRKFLLPGF